MSDVSPPVSITELLLRLDRDEARLPKRLRQCAEFTRANLHLIAVSTVSAMAAGSGVAPSVYVRFCQALGFAGYSGLQALFRAQVADPRPSYSERLASLRPDAADSAAHLLLEFAESGQRSLMNLGRSEGYSAIDEVAKGLAKARVLHLVGVRRAFAVVSNMAYLLGQLGVPVMLHPGVGAMDPGAVFDPADAVLAVTFAPFSAETLRLAELAAARGVPVYGLSDSDDCPLAESATAMLRVNEDDVAGFRTLTASITLTTALAVAVGALRKGG